MKETYILGLMSFILSGLSFMLLHARALINRIGVFLITQNSSQTLLMRFKIVLGYIDMCLFIIPAIALALALLLITKKSIFAGLLTYGVAIFAYLFFIANIV